MLVGKLPAWGKKVCLVVSQVLMLYIVVLLCKGSWDQAVINLDVTAPVTGAPMAGSGNFESFAYPSGSMVATSPVFRVALQ